MSAQSDAREVLVEAIQDLAAYAKQNEPNSDGALGAAQLALEAAITLGLAIRHNRHVMVAPEDPEPEPIQAPSLVEREPTLIHIIQALEDHVADAKEHGYDRGEVTLLRQAIQKIDQVLNEDPALREELGDLDYDEDDDE